MRKSIGKHLDDDEHNIYIDRYRYQNEGGRGNKPGDGSRIGEDFAMIIRFELDSRSEFSQGYPPETGEICASGIERSEDQFPPQLPGSHPLRDNKAAAIA